MRPLYGLELERGFFVCQARANSCRDGFVRWDAVAPTYDDGRVGGVRLSWGKSCVEQFLGSLYVLLVLGGFGHTLHGMFGMGWASLVRRMVGDDNTD